MIATKGEPTHVASNPQPASVLVATNSSAPGILPQQPPQVNSVPDPKKVEKDRHLLEALHVVFGNNIPGFPDADTQPSSD